MNTKKTLGLENKTLYSPLDYIGLLFFKKLIKLFLRTTAMSETNQEVEYADSSSLMNREPVYNNNINILDEDAELLYVRNLRLEAIRQTMKDGRIPTDPDSAEIFVKLLKDMDHSAITRKKIKSDEKNTQSISNATALVAEALKSVNGNTGRNEIPEGVVVEKLVHELPEHLKRTDFIPGELDQGTVNSTYDEFMDKMSK
jgi:hypothetical protein